MKSLINEFTFRVDLFEFYRGKFLYIETVYCNLEYVDFKSISECICEAIRKKLYDSKSSSKLNEVKYYYENCVASIPEYPMQSGYINRSNPLLMGNWTTHGVKDETTKGKKAKPKGNK